MKLSLTENTTKIVYEDASQIAHRLGHRSVETEHLLISLMEHSDNPGAEVLRRFNLDFAQLRQEIGVYVRQRPTFFGEYTLEQVKLSHQSRNVVDAARDEAQVMGHYHIGTEHLLLGLIRDGEGIAYRVLSKHGITLNRTRKEIWMVLNGIPAQGGEKNTGPASLNCVPDLDQTIREVLITAPQLEKRIRDLAKHISKDYEGRKPLLISVLKGSILFLSDLIRNMSIPITFDLMTVSSYGGKTHSSGNVKLVMDLKQDVQGRDIIIVEDIYDTGRTLKYIIEHIQLRKPSSIKTCVLVSKKCPREHEVPLDYVGFDIPNEFVVGYGLDYQEFYRQLPYIGVLKPDIYNKDSK